MTASDQLTKALNVWELELTTADRRALTIDWSNDRLCEITDSQLVARLLRGEAINSAEMAAGPAAILAQIAERLRTRASGSAYLALGSVQLNDGPGPLPVVRMGVSITRPGRQVQQLTIEPIGPPHWCSVTRRLLADEWGVSPPDPNDPAAIERFLVDLPAQLPDGQFSHRAAILIQRGQRLDLLDDIRSFPDLGSSRLVSALARESEAESYVRRCSDPADEVVPVLPADASQRRVLNRAARAENVVVEGPPGTGKSQTIANILIDAAASGKTALFVTEKPQAAAIVLRRLSEVGLREIALDLTDDLRRTEFPDQHVTGSVETPPPIPEWGELDDHHALMDRLYPVLAGAVLHAGQSLPDIEIDDATWLLDNEEYAHRVLAGVAAAYASLRDAGIEVGGGGLPSLGTAGLSLGELIDVLLLNSNAPSASIAVEQATRWGAVADVLRIADPSVALSEILADPISAVNLRFTNRGVRKRLSGRLAAVVDQLPTDIDADRRVSDLRAEALRHKLPAALPEVVLALLDDVTVRGIPLAEHAPSEAASALAKMRVLGARILSEPEVFDRLGQIAVNAICADDDPAGTLDAIVARSILKQASELRDPGVLDVVRDFADERLQSWASARLTAVRHQLVDSPDDPQHAVNLEGLVRRSRTGGAEARAVGDSLRSVLTGYPIIVAAPVTVARVFPAEPELFDLAVFDEASQLETAAAVPALARVASAVVIGDSFQLPPNTFFRGTIEKTTDPVLAQESLLDAFAVVLAGAERREMLSWHYRSEDDRLIEFVARSPLLYSGQLVATPAPPDSPNPLKFVVAGAGLIEAVIAQVRELTASGFSPSDIGVVTFGVELANEIETALILSDDAFMALAVRSVERFQGDEREAMVVVLPKTDNGSTAVQALGPINQVGGERRLNVAITRSRRRMVVVSDFEPSELASARSTGGRAVREFLMGGTVALDPRPRADAADQLIAAIAQASSSFGLTLDVQPERTRASIRLIARSPQGRTVAVDVETPSLLSMNVIDREIVRHRELLRRGWSVVRTSAAEWVLNPESATKRIREALGS